MNNIRYKSSSKKEWVTFNEWFKFYDFPPMILDQLKKFNIQKVSRIIKLPEGGNWAFEAETIGERGESEEIKIILFWHGAPKSNQFTYLIKQILEIQRGGEHPVIVINDNFRRRYQDIPTEIPIVTPFPGNSVIPPKTAFQKEKLYQSLPRLISKLTYLPLKPKAIYGYGSFFREKDLVGDLDLFVELDPEQIEWKRFDSFFMGKYEKEKETIFDQFLDVIISEQDRSRADSGGRAKSVNRMCDDPIFQQKIAQFNLNLDLLRYCDWPEIIGHDASGFPISPEIHRVFQRMWKGHTRGIELHFDKWTMDEDTPRVLLWSPSAPGVQENYVSWEEHKDEFILATYKNMINHIGKLINHYEEQAKNAFEKYKPVHTATITALYQLQDQCAKETELHMDYAILSKKINALRENLKEIREINERALKWTAVRE